MPPKTNSLVLYALVPSWYTLLRNITGRNRPFINSPDVTNVR